MSLKLKARTTKRNAAKVGNKTQIRPLPVSRGRLRTASPVSLHTACRRFDSAQVQVAPRLYRNRTVWPETQARLATALRMDYASVISLPRASRPRAARPASARATETTVRASTAG